MIFLEVMVVKIGVYDLNECSNLNYKERLNIYKEIGFTSVGLYLDDKYMTNDENYNDIIEYAYKIGLEVNQVHLDYKISNDICDDNSFYFEYVKNKLNEADKLGVKFVVVHASKGSNPPMLNHKGICELELMMRDYQNKNIYLCFENVRCNTNLKFIINSNISNIGVCYDVGHAHCYDSEDALFEEYKDKIKCTHLHNNYGEDSHNCLDDGEINIKEIISMINCNNQIDNCLEVFPKRGVILDKEEFKEFLNRNYNYYRKCIK